MHQHELSGGQLRTIVTISYKNRTSVHRNNGHIENKKIIQYIMTRSKHNVSQIKHMHRSKIILVLKLTRSTKIA